MPHVRFPPTDLWGHLWAFVWRLALWKYTTYPLRLKVFSTSQWAPGPPHSARSQLYEWLSLPFFKVGNRSIPCLVIHGEYGKTIDLKLCLGIYGHLFFSSSKFSGKAFLFSASRVNEFFWSVRRWLASRPIRKDPMIGQYRFSELVPRLLETFYLNDEFDLHSSPIC